MYNDHYGISKHSPVISLRFFGTFFSTDKTQSHECSDFHIGQSMRYSKAPNIYMRAKSKSFKMAATLVIVFLVCWVPYYLVRYECVHITSCDAKTLY